MKHFAPVVALLALASCAPASDDLPQPAGPVAAEVDRLAATYDVPADLALAIAAVEGGLTLPAWRSPDPDATVPVAGILELRHGAFDSLAQGAKLLGRTELQLRADTDLGTEAGLAVLSRLGREHGAQSSDLASWASTVAELSGLRGTALQQDYVARVYRILRSGGDFPARDGEVVRIAPHPGLPASLFMPPPGLQTLATPDFPGATWVDTPQANKWTPGRPDGNAAVNMVVIHDTEGGWDASLATLQNDTGKSAHYLVDADGSRVVQFVSEYDTAWQAGNWYYNTRSIGIEHVGYVSDPNGYATALYDKSVELVKSIRTRWTIPLDRAHIIGHYQVPNGNAIPESSPPCSAGLDACESDTNYGGASHHTDPGYHWQWCQYMEMLGGTCACNDAWSLWNCTNDGTEVWRCNNGTLEKQDCESCDVMPVGTPDVCHPKSGPEPVPEASSSEDAQEEADAPSSADAPLWPDAAAPEAGHDAAASGAAPVAALSSGEPSGCACSTGGSHRDVPGGLGAIACAAAMLVARRRDGSRRGR